MATIKTLNKAGSTRIKKTGSGLELVRVAVVGDFTTTGDERLMEALSASGLPAIGEALPGYPTMLLTSIDPHEMGDGGVNIDLTYTHQQVELVGSNTVGTIEVGAEFAQVESTFDKDRKTVLVHYKYPSTSIPTFETFPKWDIKLCAQTIAQPGVTVADVAEPFIRFTRTERVSPLYIADNYANTINAAGWVVDPAAPEGTWRCTSIVGSATPAGTWRVSYEFKKRRDGWNPEATFTVDGKVVPIATTATSSGTVTDGYGFPETYNNGTQVVNHPTPSIRRVSRYRVIDFNVFNFPAIGPYPPYIE